MACIPHIKATTGILLAPENIILAISKSYLQHPKCSIVCKCNLLVGSDIVNMVKLWQVKWKPVVINIHYISPAQRFLAGTLYMQSSICV